MKIGPSDPFEPQNQRYRDYARQRQMTLGDLLLENRIVFLGSSPETGGQAAITDYVAKNNAAPKPFVWTKAADVILQKVDRARAALNSVKTGNQA